MCTVQLYILPQLSSSMQLRVTCKFNHRLAYHKRTVVSKWWDHGSSHILLKSTEKKYKNSEMAGSLSQPAIKLTGSLNKHGKIQWMWDGCGWNYLRSTIKRGYCKHITKTGLSQHIHPLFFFLSSSFNFAPILLVAICQDAVHVLWLLQLHLALMYINTTFRLLPSNTAVVRISMWTARSWLVMCNPTYLF